MKNRIFLFLVIFFAFSCRNNNSDNFDWLLGDWKRVNDKEGNQTFESWTRGEDNVYYGFGYTMQDSDTIWQEEIRLVKNELIWNFEVTGKGETKPTTFSLTTLEEGRFICENFKNEFPKVIAYFKTSNGLEAIISDGKTKIPFVFERVK